MRLDSRPHDSLSVSPLLLVVYHTTPFNCHLTYDMKRFSFLIVVMYTENELIHLYARWMPYTHKCIAVCIYYHYYDDYFYYFWFFIVHRHAQCAHHKRFSVYIYLIHNQTNIIIFSSLSLVYSIKVQCNSLVLSIYYFWIPIYYLIVSLCIYY